MRPDIKFVPPPREAQKNSAQLRLLAAAPSSPTSFPSFSSVQPPQNTRLKPESKPNHPERLFQINAPNRTKSQPNPDQTRIKPGSKVEKSAQPIANPHPQNHKNPKKTEPTGSLTLCTPQTPISLVRVFRVFRGSVRQNPRPFPQFQPCALKTFGHFNCSALFRFVPPKIIAVANLVNPATLNGRLLLRDWQPIQKLARSKL